MSVSSRGLRFLALALLILAAILSAWGASSEAPHASRRAAVMAKIAGGVAIIPSQLAGPRGTQDSKEFYYLTGIAQPEAVLVLVGDTEKREILFNRAGKWAGESSPGPLEVRAMAELRSFLPRALRDKKAYVSFQGLDGTLEALGGAAAISGAAAILPIDPILAEMRMIKSPDEIQTLQQAIDITAEAFVEVLKAARPGMTEKDIDAVIQFTNLRRQATSSFTQVASGPNSVNIHFGSTPRVLQAGDVIVFDLGAWFEKNTSDISRTIPVSGKFTPEQAEIYDLVLRAQKEAISLMKPGTTAIQPQEAAEKVLLEGLARLGLVTDPASPWQRRFYIQHGFGHGIGLDVHDVWSWWSPRMRTETLKPGMVLTMEPGLYFPAGRLEQVPAMFKAQAPEDALKAFVAKVSPVYAKYAGMGCRIEDDVLITETGNRVLSSAAPKEIADIEKMMKESSPFNQIIKSVGGRTTINDWLLLR